MGLFDFLKRLLFGKPSAGQPPSRSTYRPKPALYRSEFRYKNRRSRQSCDVIVTTDAAPPYRFANFGDRPGTYFDLRDGTNLQRLQTFDVPRFETPDELANWLNIPVGKLAWLIHRFDENRRPENEGSAHYWHRWIPKRSGGSRLVEAPKPILKSVQQQILREILDRVPPHSQAHGFILGRSIVTNARIHCGQRVVVKWDLQNFYANVKYSRVVAIFRSLGYGREAAIWLARLTTSTVPWNIQLPKEGDSALAPYLSRHLPQGAPTSPALANLSAYSLDLRLSGLARSFGANYSRYADDLTFSGSEHFLCSLPAFLPLAARIVQSERFRINRAKRHIIRSNQRQSVTGIVVNERPNLSRRDVDRLKAILHNCRRLGPSSQNRDAHDDFAAHLRGRIAHVMHVNPNRGERLLEIFEQIDWRR